MTLLEAAKQYSETPGNYMDGWMPMGRTDKAFVAGADFERDRIIKLIDKARTEYSAAQHESILAVLTIALDIEALK